MTSKLLPARSSPPGEVNTIKELVSTAQSSAPAICLQSAPELAKLMGEELPEPAGDGGTLTAVGPGFSPASAGAQGGLDNPLGFDDELTEEDELVKHPPFAELCEYGTAGPQGDALP